MTTIPSRFPHHSELLLSHIFNHIVPSILRINHTAAPIDIFRLILNQYPASWDRILPCQCPVCATAVPFCNIFQCPDRFHTLTTPLAVLLAICQGRIPRLIIHLSLLLLVIHRVKFGWEPDVNSSIIITHLPRCVNNQFPSFLVDTVNVLW